MSLPQVPIRVVIADACSVMRTGLTATIESESQMQVIATAAHRHELIPLLHMMPIDVLVIDVAGIGDAPVALLREITQAHPRLGIVVFSATIDFVPELLVVGVKAYVSHEEPDDQLHLAIRAAKAGQRFLSPVVEAYVERCGVPRDKDRLSPKELRCLMYVAQGLDNQEIADRMGVDLRTVQNYVWKIRKKTSCTNRAQMTCWYKRMYGRAGNLHSPLHFDHQDSVRQAQAT